MTRPQHIFLDLDGVLVDLYGALLKEFDQPHDIMQHCYLAGCRLPESTEAFINKSYVWDSAAVRSPAFWASLPCFPWTERLYGRCLNMASHVSILSNPGRDWFAPAASSGKATWVADNLRQFLTPLILCREKWLLAAPGRVLIDDDEENCRRWEEHGGTAFLFPSPRNANYAQTTCDPVIWVEDRMREAFP